MVPLPGLGERNAQTRTQLEEVFMSTTMQDLTIVLDDKPGTLAKAAEAIAAERINIEGGATINCGGEGLFHALFKAEQDAGSAKRALEKAGFKVRAQEPVVGEQPQDRPGAVARSLRWRARGPLPCRSYGPGRGPPHDPVSAARRRPRAARDRVPPRASGCA